jgi:hypothetical protein
VFSGTAVHAMSEFRLLEQVANLIHDDCCRARCLAGKATALEIFAANVNRMSRKEKRLCILASHSILYVAEESTPARVRTTGERIRFRYYVPYVGCVSKTSFMNCFNISAPTITRYKRQVLAGRLTRMSSQGNIDR